MYCLSVIHTINERESKRQLAKKNIARDCSFNVTNKGMVLHSAKLRSTIFIPQDSDGYWKLVLDLETLQDRSNKRDLNKVIESFFA